MSINDLPDYIREAHNKLLADTPDTVAGEIYERRYMLLLEMLSLIWKRVMPNAALKNAEAWIERDKDRQREEIDAAARREKQLATPVTVFLDGTQLKLPRLLYEEIEDAQWSWCNAGHDFDDTIADVLKPLLRDGFIELAEDRRVYNPDVDGWDGKPARHMDDGEIVDK